jgi:hypothetical protein
LPDPPKNYSSSTDYLPKSGKVTKDTVRVNYFIFDPDIKDELDDYIPENSEHDDIILPYNFKADEGYTVYFMDKKPRSTSLFVKRAIAESEHALLSDNIYDYAGLIPKKSICVCPTTESSRNKILKWIEKHDDCNWKEWGEFVEEFYIKNKQLINDYAYDCYVKNTSNVDLNLFSSKILKEMEEHENEDIVEKAFEIIEIISSSKRDLIKKSYTHIESCLNYCHVLNAKRIISDKDIDYIDKINNLIDGVSEVVNEHFDFNSYNDAIIKKVIKYVLFYYDKNIHELDELLDKMKKIQNEIKNLEALQTKKSEVEIDEEKDEELSCI